MFPVTDIATVAEGVQLVEHGSGGIGGHDVVAQAVALADVMHHDGSIFVQNGHYIALDVDGVIVGYAVAGHGLGMAGSVVGEVQNMGFRYSLTIHRSLGIHCHPCQLAPPPLCKGRWHGVSRDGGIVRYVLAQNCIFKICTDIAIPQSHGSCDSRLWAARSRLWLST